MGESSAKKRRIADDASPKSKKKKVDSQSQGAPAQVEVTSVIKPKLCPPVIATTPGIDLSQSIKFQSYAKAEKASAAKRRKNGAAPPPELLLNSSTHRSLDYTAREDRPNGAEPLLKHYIGVFDPRSGKLEVIEARKMAVRGIVRSQMASEEAMEERNVKQTMFEMRTELGEAFGTKKAKKAIKSVAENAITGGVKMGTGELAVVNSIKDSTQNMATQEELQAAVDLARPVPRANLDADEIQDVYRPQDIIGSEVLKAIPILDWQEAVKSLEPVNVRSRFVADRIVRVASNEGAVQRLKVLRYMLWVIIFWNSARPGKIKGTMSVGKREILRDNMPEAPELVIENIRRKFSDGGVMRKTHQDLLMTHCCVFSLIVDNFVSDTLDLREDLKLEQKQLNTYFAEVGARMSQKKSGDKVEHTAKLFLPLQFPKIRQARRRK